jgi:hypothetical protein
MLAHMRQPPSQPASSAAPSVRPPRRAGVPSPRALLILALLGLALLGWLVYLPGLHGGFVFDDFSNIVDQPALAPQALSQHFWQSIWAGRAGPFSRALSMLSFAWQVRVWGMYPLPMKVFNVLLHLLNAGLIAWLSLRVLEWIHAREREQRGAEAPDWVLAPRTLAVLVAGAWLLAPIQLTAVLYVVQREESLAACFVLVGLLGYWHGRMLLRDAVQAGRSQRRAWAWIWASLLGGTVVAALAKETGVMLPAYAAVLEWVVLRGDCGAAAGPSARDARCSLLGVYGLLLVLPGVLGLAWLLPGVLSGAAYAQRDFSLGQRLLTEGRVLVDYLHWILLPDPGTLSLYHDDVVVSGSWLHPWTTAPSWLLLAGLLGAGLWLRRRRPVVSLGILWFFAGHSLVSTFVPLDLVYEHRNYLPCWGVFLAAFGLLGTWRPREPGSWRLVAGLLCAGLLALYAGFTAMRAQIWGNPVRLAYFEATAHPRSPRAVYDLGRVLYLIAPDADSQQFRLARRFMLQASEIPGADLQPLQALVFMQAKRGLPVPQAWWDELRRSIASQRLGVENVSALYSLVQCAVDRVCQYRPADLDQLGALLDAGVRAHQDNAEIITLRANFEANVVHRFPQAYADMLRAVALDPGSFSYWKNLVQLQIAARQLSQAKVGLERLRELDPFGLHRAQRVALRRQWLAARAAAAASAPGVAR